MEEKEKQYYSVLNNIKEVIFQTDMSGLWTYLNKPWTELTGFSIEESLGVRYLDFVHPDDRELDNQKFIPLLERKKEYCRHIIRYITKDDSFKWIEIYARLTIDESDNIIGTSGTLNDVTGRILAENELIKYKEHLEELIAERTKELNETNLRLEYLVTHDSLTGLPNRYSLENALANAISNAKVNNKESSLIFVDIDNFRVINDTYGHAVGDELLKELSKIGEEYLLLQNINLNESIFVRLGGDEFAAVIYGSYLEKTLNAAEQMRSELEKLQITLPSGITTSVTVSVGIVKIDGTLSPQEMFAYTETALYSAKNNGKNRIEVIESIEDKENLSKMNKMVTLIKASLKENKFILFYQPICKFDGEIIHFEALIRMFDENNSILLPDSFIPIAERFGLMSQIDRWVITEALKTLTERRDIHVFVNISGISLGDKSLLKFIEDSINASNVEPSRLGFEITETTAVKDLSQSNKWITKLKALGCKFALDDFGVGFSSFSYLSDFPIDFLKIDGSFVKKIDIDKKSKDLVVAMNEVAHALGKETIAEFVTSEEIVKILKEIKVDCGQGYFLGKPGVLPNCK